MVSLRERLAWQLVASGRVVGRRLLAVLVVALIGLSACGSRHPAHPARTHTIGFDRYSLILDGRRVFVWSGEFHPFRLPEPLAVARCPGEDEGRRLQRRLDLL